MTNTQIMYPRQALRLLETSSYSQTRHHATNLYKYLCS